MLIVCCRFINPISAAVQIAFSLLNSTMSNLEQDNLMPTRRPNAHSQKRATWTHVRRDAYFRCWDGLHADAYVSPKSGISVAVDMRIFALSVLAAFYLAVHSVYAMLCAPFKWLETFFRQAPHTKSAPENLFTLTRRRTKSVRKPKSFMARLVGQFTTYEFWLGVAAGLTTRALAYRAIEATFAAINVPLSSLAATFVACGGAGLAAGFAVYFIRFVFRRMTQPQHSLTERFWGRGLLSSALTGLLGGMMGGGMYGSGTLLASSETLVVGGVIGATIGVVNAVVQSAGQRAEHGILTLALRGMAFGAIGGVVGASMADVLGVHNAMAAPAPDAHNVHFSHVAEGTSTAPHAATAMATDAHPTTSATPFIKPPAAMADTSPAVDTAHTAHADQVVCYHPHHHAHHHHRHHYVRHAHHHHAHPAKPLEPSVVVMPQEPLQAPYHPPLLVEIPLDGPVQTVQPTVTMPHSPCASGNCAPSCDQQTQIDLRGPCADPGMSCVERVSFNDQGDATRVVLEPHANGVHAPQFERMADNNARYHAQTVVADADAGDGDAKVSLVMPFNPRAAMAPMPA